MKIKGRFACAFRFFVIAGIFSFGAGELFAGDWQSLQSGNLSVIYRQDANLRRVERSLRRRYFPTDLRGEYENSAYQPDRRIGFRLQAILSRVKELLGMYPDMPELSVQICKNRNELAAEYERIFSSAARYKSFYVPKLSTVFISEQDISDSVIAHEFAHAVVDRYFSSIPPPQIAELISVYVDTHLED